jgi:hypothetical protein
MPNAECRMRSAQCGTTPARTSLRGGAADAAIQCHPLTIVRRIDHMKGQTSGLPRRCAPRSDGGSGLPRRFVPRRDGGSGLPRRYAPRRDGGSGLPRRFVPRRDGGRGGDGGGRDGRCGGGGDGCGGGVVRAGAGLFGSDARFGVNGAPAVIARRRSRRGNPVPSSYHRPPH